jgi:hypothetical protein
MLHISKFYTGYFTSDNEPGGTENATHHNTFETLKLRFPTKR